MRTKVSSITLLAGILLILMSGAVNAAPVTFNFEGVIGSVYSNEFSGVNPGETFTGSFTFESEKEDSDPRTNAGQYSYSSLSPGGMTMTVQFAGITLETDLTSTYPVGAPYGSSNILVWDNAGLPEFPSGPADRYEVSSIVTLPSGNGGVIFFGFYTYNNLEFLTSDKLPTTPPNINLADDLLWTFHVNEQIPGGSMSALGGHITYLSTEPELPPEEDIDNDGLLNGWEINGFDENGDGTIDLDLPALGADPMHKDLFVEVDAMVGRAPTQAALNRVVDAFAAVPNSLVDNPDGMDGITLHIQLDETNIPLADWPNAFDDFDDVKDNRFGTAAQREDANWSNIENAKAEVYRYCIFANRYRWVYPNGNVTWSSSGLGEYPGNDFMVTLGEAWGGTEDQQVGTFMHEFGHNLNLHHGGNDGINFKPNYHSIMNYHWQMPHSNHTGWGLDYSREVLPTLNESNLDESVGIGGNASATVPVGPLPVVVVNESGPIDWNRNNILETGVSADINYVRTQGDGGPSPGQVLTGNNDWSVLWYRLSGHSNFQDGVHIDIPEEMTYEVYREVYGPRINARLDFEPDTFNLGSRGQFVTTYIELTQGFNVSNIDVSSLMLNISVTALSTPVEIGDYDSDGITDLMVKFDRQEVIEILEPGEQLVYLTGRLSDGTSLTGDEIIWVLPTKGVE